MGLLHTEAASSMGLNCYLCGTAFWMERGIYDARKRDGRNFWCPNGHDQHFTEKTPDQKRIDDLESQLRQERSAAEAHQRRADEQRRAREWAETRAKGANIAAGKAKAQLRRTLTRVEAGVCPRCKRTFKQLAEHMACKHPQTT